jgi:hypothetical protein
VSRRPLLVIETLNATYSEPRTSYVWLAASSRWRTPDLPRFHRLEPSSPLTYTAEGAEWSGRTLHTSCGLLAARTRWAERVPDSYTHEAFGIELPICWAVEFGEPCARCWP